MKNWAIGKVSIAIFLLIVALWVAFQIWHQFGGPPADGLTPLMTTSLTFAVAMNSIEKKSREDKTNDRITTLEQNAETQGES